MYGSLTFLPHNNFAVFDGWYFLQYCLQRAENCTNCTTFELSSYTYGHGFHELSCMLMRKNVNNDVSKDSPIHLVHRAPTDKLRKVENNVIIFLKIIKPDICIIFSFSRTAPAEYANLRKADFARANRARVLVSCWQDGEQIFFQTLLTSNLICLQNNVIVTSRKPRSLHTT